MSEIDPTIPIVIVGAVDHGKSTFIGRLLVDTNQLTPDRLEDLEAVSRDLHQKKEYAHVTDQFQEEREANITIDTTQFRFKWKEQTYVLIDAPGHREYLANMITGASRAEHALLMLDVSEGLREQTEKHAEILKLLSVSHLAVLINKMDLVGYDQAVYDRHRKLIEESLSSRGLKASAIIPLAAYAGENITKKSALMSWYHGPTALQFIESCSSENLSTKPLSLRFPIQIMHEVNGLRLALGRVEEGTLQENEFLKVFPSGKKVQVKHVKIHGQPEIKSAEAGISVGVEVDAPAILKRGLILYGGTETLRPPERLKADVFWASESAVKPNDEIFLECRTQSALGRVKRIVDPESKKDLTQLGAGELGRVEIELKDPIYLEPHLQSDVFGRFVFNRAGETVGCGIVAELE